MIQRILVLIIIYIIILIIPAEKISFISFVFFNNQAFAQETLKINSINFDNSDSIIFLGTSGTTEPADIKKTKKVLSEPDRVFFDIENSIITFPNTTYELKNSRLKQLKIAQNSTRPDIVRIVIWNSSNYDASQIKVLKIKNNIIIKLSNEIPLQQYLTQIYRETKESAVEYYDKAVVIPEEQPLTRESDEIFNKVQQAFKEDDNQIVRPNIEQKQARLKSRFFLEKAIVKNGNLLISGIGVINAAKPFYLTEPSRIVFDLPNTIVLQELRDKTFKLSETETVRIGQFEPSVARIVINTNTPDAYKPIYSTTLQSLLIANENNLSGVNLTSTSSELAYFKEQNVNPRTKVINIIFSTPIVYSIKRENLKFNITVYNLTNFSTAPFNAVARANKSGFEAKQTGANIYNFSFPVNKTTLVDCYETINASQLRLVFTMPEIQKTIQPIQTPQTTIKEKEPVIKLPVSEPIVRKSTTIKRESPLEKLAGRTSGIIKPAKKVKDTSKAAKKIRNKTVIIDPGHGGNDTGAMRGNVLEKDLTLEIALKVKEILKEKGMNNVIMTRSTDKTLSLNDRVEIANNNKADIFVSIHINASVKSEINGIETHYCSNSGYKVAEIIHKQLTENVAAADRGLFKSKFYVINHTEAPAVLLELGFISNERERNSLTSDKRQTDSAQAIAEGIIDYLTEH